MSAFIVSKAHIDALVNVAIFGPRDPERQWHGISWPRPCEPYAPAPDYPQYVTDVRWMKLTPSGVASLVRDGEVSADEVGFILWAENVASVSYRYHDETAETLPGTLTATGEPEVMQGYSFSRMAKRPTTVEALKLISCLDYQSCEHEGWKASEAFKILEGLKDGLIGCLTGYSAAPWEWSA